VWSSVSTAEARRAVVVRDGGVMAR